MSKISLKPTHKVISYCCFTHNILDNLCNIVALFVRFFEKCVIELAVKMQSSDNRSVPAGTSEVVSEIV
jgi:hypothetical protein